VAGLPPAEFAKRLAGVRDNLAGLARNAAEGVLDGMNDIAETAVKRLVERTPRSPDGETHIADGWTARKADAGPGLFAIEVVNTDPRATENLRLADGTVTDYTLLEILEYGSKAHDIFPVNAPALRFSIGGVEIHSQHVRHPGTRPYNMVGLTSTEVAIDVKRLIDATRRTLTLKQTGRI